MLRSFQVIGKLYGEKKAFFLNQNLFERTFILVNTPLDYSCCKPALLHQLTDSPNRIGTIGFN